MANQSIYANTAFDYQFNFTADLACTNILYSTNFTITTDSYGLAFKEINVGSLIANPYYVCEYRALSGNPLALRARLNVSDGIFNRIIANNITAQLINSTGTLYTSGKLVNSSLLYNMSNMQYQVDNFNVTNLLNATKITTNSSINILGDGLHVINYDFLFPKQPFYTIYWLDSINSGWGLNSSTGSVGFFAGGRSAQNMYFGINALTGLMNVRESINTTNITAKEITADTINSQTANHTTTNTSKIYIENQLHLCDGNLIDCVAWIYNSTGAYTPYTTSSMPMALEEFYLQSGYVVSGIEPNSETGRVSGWYRADADGRQRSVGLVSYGNLIALFYNKTIGFGVDTFLSANPESLLDIAGNVTMRRQADATATARIKDSFALFFQGSSKQGALAVKTVNMSIWYDAVNTTTGGGYLRFNNNTATAFSIADNGTIFSDTDYFGRNLVVTNITSTIQLSPASNSACLKYQIAYNDSNIFVCNSTGKWMMSGALIGF